jgi:hypothetical protein
MVAGVYVFGASRRADGMEFSELAQNVDRLLAKAAERVNARAAAKERP